MELGLFVKRYKHARHGFFDWRSDLTLINKVTLAIFFACLTGLMAQMRIYLPITPVPVTGQVFAVLLAGVLLGGRYGSLSQLFYAGIGAAGVPWFAGAASGIGYLTGVTGGYLVGFIVAAFVIGEFTDRYVASRGLVPQMLLMTTGIGIIYTLGSLQLALVLDLSLSEAILMGALPFVPVDLVKAFAAATVAFGILPKTSYTEELDAEKYPYEF